MKTWNMENSQHSELLYCWLIILTLVLATMTSWLVKHLFIYLSVRRVEEAQETTNSIF